MLFEKEYSLTPPYRFEIDARFPAVIKIVQDVDILREKISKAVASYQDRKHLKINIVYPQKNPKVFKKYRNHNHMCINKMFNSLSAARPDIEWVLRDDIYENVSLERSEDQSVVHALTSRQEFSIGDKKKFKLSEKLEFSKELFFVADHTIDSGTTIANTMSFIEYNGGKVLAATNLHSTYVKEFYSLNKFIDIYSSDYSSREECYISQSKPYDYEDNLIGTNHGDIPYSFLRHGSNNKRVAQLANVFSASSQREGENQTTGECIVAFEKAINRHGNSVLALTNHECAKISCAMLREDNKFEFSNLIKELNSVRVKRDVVPPPYSPLVKNFSIG